MERVYYPLKHHNFIKDEFTTVWFLGERKNTDEYNKLVNLQNDDWQETPNLEFVLRDEAKLTDLIAQHYISSIGLLSSNRLVQILRNFILPPFLKVYPARVFKGVSFYDYNWLHFTSDMIQMVDFENTVFFEFDTIEKRKLEDVKFNTSDDLFYFQLKNTDNINISSNKIVVNVEDILLWDLFFCAVPEHSIYVSENLKNTIEMNQVSGLSFGSKQTFSCEI